MIDLVILTSLHSLQEITHSVIQHLRLSNVTIDD